MIFYEGSEVLDLLVLSKHSLFCKESGHLKTGEEGLDF